MSSTLALLVGCAGALAPLRAQAPSIDEQQIDEQLQTLARPGPRYDSPAARRKLFQSLLARPTVHARLAEVIDRRLARLELNYAVTLDEPIRRAYRDRLMSLGKEDMRTVARTRRVWRSYILETSTQSAFQQHFLAPAVAVGELLLPDVERLQTKESRARRKLMIEYDRYRARVREALGLDADPTSGKTAPTGVAIPRLGRVRTYEEHLDHLHRTLAVSSSVAPREAQHILLANATKAREIDFEEAEFILFANEVRMLMGTVAWATDVLACAATRDHSNDRVAGKAKGHWSSLPGKKGFTDRMRRFGTSARSEGAGGGGNGRAYLRNLSYGGGHTGPLYSLKRNVVGVGRSGNTYASVYRGDDRLLHPCHARDGELFMPPGVRVGDLQNPELVVVCSEIAAENYERARALVRTAKVDNGFEKTLLRYLETVIEVEADWQLECIARVAAVGDLHGVETRIRQVRKEFGAALDKRLAPFERQLSSKAGAIAVAAGRAYRAASAAGDDAAIQAIIDRHPDTVYAKAAAHWLGQGKRGEHPLTWFLTVDPELNRFEFLSDRAE